MRAGQGALALASQLLASGPSQRRAAGEPGQPQGAPHCPARAAHHSPRRAPRGTRPCAAPSRAVGHGLGLGPCVPRIWLGRAAFCAPSCGPSTGLGRSGRRGTDGLCPSAAEHRPTMLLHCLLLLLPGLATATAPAPPGCRIRITAKGLELVKREGLRFVEQELANITTEDLHGKEGHFHYNISNLRVTHLQLPFSDLRFEPRQHLAFDIRNASISLRLRRQLLYWFFYDAGSITTSAEGVHIHTALELSKGRGGRLRVSAMNCSASIARMSTGVSGTLRKVYAFLAAFVTTGVRILLNRQICPVMNHAGLVLLNSLLDTVPVRNPVDKHIGIDYSLLSNPAVQADTMDLDFKGMFFPLGGWNETLPNVAVEPVIREAERMVYVALSEFFFDSALLAYYRAGLLSVQFAGEQVPTDLAVLLRATLFGSLLIAKPSVVDTPLVLRLHVSAPPRCTIRPWGMSISVTALLSIYLAPAEQPLVALSSITMESQMSGKVTLHGKALRVQLDLNRFRIYSSQSALESLALLPLQAPLKTLLQLAVMPLINGRTRQGVQIPLPEGMDFVKEEVTHHRGYLTVGADLHFSKGLREVIEQHRGTPGSPPHFGQRPLRGP
uniref:Phospholipid transfer protein n=1 Tax=Varanus komodoensis TaxID=61221 RepID=A0A8D2KY65_VARKO